MPNSKDLSLDKFGISKEKYRELKYFCRQYCEKKQKVIDLMSLKATNLNGLPGGSGVSDPTAEKALKAAKEQADIDLIEQTVREAEPGIYKWLLVSVTEGIPYEQMPVPCGRRQFYEARRKFFYLLSEKR